MKPIKSPKSESILQPLLDAFAVATLDTEFCLCVIDHLELGCKDNKGYSPTHLKAYLARAGPVDTALAESVCQAQSFGPYVGIE